MKTTAPDSRTTASEALFSKAQALLPGGVNSPVRAYKAVGGTPRFIARADGARVWDEDGNELLDYVGAWGPMILGHRHPAVVAAVERQLAAGFAFGAPTALEVEMAAAVAQVMPSIEMVRFVSSGTEATMAARAPRARGDESAASREVRRLLSRPRRQLPGEGGIGSGDLWDTRQPGRHRRNRARYVDRAIQRRRTASARSWLPTRPRSPRSSSSRSSATWASSRQSADVPQRPAASSPLRMARCSSSTR